MLGRKYMSIDDLNLSVRPYNVIKRHGIMTVNDLVTYIRNSGKKWTNLRNLGTRSADEIIKKVCAATGLSEEEFAYRQ